MEHVLGTLSKTTVLVYTVRKNTVGLCDTRINYVTPMCNVITFFFLCQTIHCTYNHYSMYSTILCLIVKRIRTESFKFHFLN